MTQYIGIYLPLMDAEVAEVNAALDAGEPVPDYFYSHPVPIVNPGCQTVCWHCLVTREQYDKRIEDGKLVTSFSGAPPAWTNGGIPFHVFGQGIHLPIEDQPEPPLEVP